MMIIPSISEASNLQNSAKTLEVPKYLKIDQDHTPKNDSLWKELEILKKNM